MAFAVGVKTLHPDYERLAPKWQRCRDVIAGQDAIHAAGTAYLPMLVDELPAEYNKRVARTPFFNASFRTVSSFVGMMFRKPPSLEVSDKLKLLLDDVTMSGVSFDDMVQDAAFEDFEVSRLGVLVDYPKWQAVAGDKTLTLAQAEALGLRPSMQLYKAEAIRNWEHRRINNRTVLSQVRLAEVERIVKSEFEFDDRNRIKVLDLHPETNLYRVRVFDEETEAQVGEDVYPLLDGKPMTEIPFYFIGPDGTDDRADDPVLIDLFDHNIKHYQVSADYEHACHMTALPTPWVTGYKNDFDEDGNVKPASFYIGSTTAWVFPDSNTQVGFLEFTGAGIEALKNNLDSKKEEMASIGARAIAPEKSGVEASSTLVIRNTGENSVLSAVAIAISRGFTKALNTFARWAGDNTPCVFNINRDFIPFSIDPTAITAWIALVQGSYMDSESLFNLLKRGDLIEPGKTFEEMQAIIDANPPMPPPVAAPPKGEGEDDKPPKKEE
jgi:hypothetical protein